LAQKIGRIWLSSDLHEKHKNILKYCPNRKFSTIEEMDKAIRDHWFKIVKPEDTIIIVGDFTFGSSDYPDIHDRPGKKILVRGNHDRSSSRMLSLGFDWVCEEMTIKIQGRLVKISHLPYLKYYINMKTTPELEGAFDLDKVRFKDLMPIDNGNILIHGHVHSLEKVKDNMIHVGWDAWGRFVSEDEVASLISKIENKEKENEKNNNSIINNVSEF